MSCTIPKFISRLWYLQGLYILVNQLQKSLYVFKYFRAPQKYYEDKTSVCILKGLDPFLI